ncbi:ComEC/Rec2 family competence protein [Leptospira sp. GIMC2001]|uniref:ComEC/Rec2 family competence protein n=1 Tax=Leptospira sp. GIMC2001 TaxID=1513297 RepID=UPI002349D0AB|nr:ComEC/Rec2 family competence protein [Leptospira sp. GIMC2001]WCL50406.1 ComEC/Rec2 family competence protein [Leptospira sp. GIMC2001]
MEKYLPRSGIAILAAGILFAEFLVSTYTIENTQFTTSNLENVLIQKLKYSDPIFLIIQSKLFIYSFILISLLVLHESLHRFRILKKINLRKISIKGDNKYIHKFILGISIGLLVLAYRNAQTKINQDSLDQFLSLLKKDNSEWTITPGSMIRKGIYLSKWENGDKQFNFPLQIYKPESIYKMQCLPDSIQPQDLKNENYLHKSLIRFGNKYFRIRIQNCKQLDEIDYPNISIKNKLESKLQSYGLKKNELAIAMGLIFGDSGYLDRDFYQAALESGTLHLFAASGLHIGILIGFLYFIGKYLFRFNYYLAYSFPLILAAFYLYLLAFPVSLTRAFYFAFSLVVSKMIFRTIRPIDLLLTSALVVFLFRDDMYRSIGFYLSFSAVAGIFFLKPALDSILFFGKKTIISQNLTLTLAASFGTFLPAFTYFEGFSWGGILSNFFLVPLTSIILPFLYLNIFLDWFIPHSLVTYLWVLLNSSLKFLSFSMKFISYHFGFYRNWEASLEAIVIYSIAISFFLLLCYEIISKNQNKYSKTDSSKSTEQKVKNLWFHRICFFLGYLFIIGFFIYGHSQGNDIRDPKKDGIYHLSNDSYFLIQGKNGSLGGYCGNDQESLRRNIHFYTCKNLDYLYIDHYSCLAYVSFCFASNKDLKFLIGSRKIRLDHLEIPEGQVVKIKKNSFYSIAGESFLFFKSGFDPDWLPKYIAKKHPHGTIILQKPEIKKDPTNSKKSKLKDLPTEKSLGLSKQWKILNLNDISRFSLFQADRDTKSSGSEGSEPTEILGPELFD